MSRARQVGSLLVMVGVVAFTTATGKPKKDTPKPTSFPDPTPTQTAPFVPPAPNDIEPLLLAASLGCASKPTNVGCKLLKEFEVAETWVDLPTPS